MACIGTTSGEKRKDFVEQFSLLIGGPQRPQRAVAVTEAGQLLVEILDRLDVILVELFLRHAFLDDVLHDPFEP